MITPRFLWAEIERTIVSSPLDPKPEPIVPVSTPVLSGATGLERRKARRIGVFAIQKRAKFTIPRPQETEKNTRITRGLEAVYGIEKTRTVLEQALTMYHVSNPQSPTEPEIYEMFENGQIDEALELFGQNWVIGRPRID